MIPVAMELGCALRLVWDGDGEVVVPGVRGIRWRWDGHGEFGQCAVAALPTLFGPQRRRKMGGGRPRALFPCVAGLGPADEVRRQLLAAGISFSLCSCCSGGARQVRAEFGVRLPPTHVTSNLILTVLILHKHTHP
jgi:hypothetical protein